MSNTRYAVMMTPLVALTLAFMVAIHDRIFASVALAAAVGFDGIIDLPYLIADNPVIAVAVLAGLIAAAVIVVREG